jgi:hypothetical protein
MRQIYEEVDFNATPIGSCDELSARKGHRYLSVSADLKAMRLQKARKDKDESTWGLFRESSSAWGNS